MVKEKNYNLRLTNEWDIIRKDLEGFEGVTAVGYEDYSISEKRATAPHAHIMLETTKCEATIRKRIKELGYIGNNNFSLSNQLKTKEDYEASMRYLCKGREEGDYNVEILSKELAQQYHEAFWKIARQNDQKRRKEGKKKSLTVNNAILEYICSHTEEFIDSTDTVVDDKKIFKFIVFKYIENKKPHNIYEIDKIFHLCLGIVNPHDHVEYMMTQSKFYNNYGTTSCGSISSRGDEFNYNFLHPEKKDTMKDYFKKTQIEDESEDESEDELETNRMKDRPKEYDNESLRKYEEVDISKYL